MVAKAPLRRLALFFAAASIAAAPARAQANATDQYRAALARDTAARASADTTPTTLRSIASAYEGVVRQHPTSGYADDALWQAAGMLEMALGKSGEARDRSQAIRDLKWLKTEYPTSPYVKQVDGRVAKLETSTSTAAGSTAAAATAPMTSRATAARPAAPAPTTTPAPSRAQTTAVPTNTDAAATTPVTASAPKEPPALLRGITHAGLPKGDRVTLELSRETTYTVSRAAGPDRLIVEVVNLSTSPSDAVPALPTALLKTATVGRGANGAARVTLEVAGQPHYSSFVLYNPFRIVIDIEGDAPVAGAARSGRPPTAAAATEAGDYSLARQLGLNVSKIVIDPGHGGYDPGASANGLTEAELVLDVALRLETLLRAQPGTDVVLTRRTDVFIPLEQRTAMANREGADLFLSIHANSSPQAATRGIETFLLNFATNPQAEALAARENASSGQSMGDLPTLVKAIALNNKVAESRELATVVQGSLARRLGPQSKGLNNLGVKQAPFAVLIGAQMPSILTEISFLTNKTDAGLLRQSAYRQRIAQALCDAVIAYRTSLKKTPTVAARLQ